MMKKIIAAVLLSVAAPVFAAAGDSYVGVSLGNGTPNVTPTTGVALSKTSSFIFGGIAGYQYNRNLAVEGQFTGVGKASDARGNSVKADALSLSMVGILPLANNFELLGKIGVASVKTTSSGVGAVAGASRNGITYGVGAQYNVNRNLGLRLLWDRYAVSVNNAGLKTNSNANVVTAAAVYNF